WMCQLLVVSLARFESERKDPQSTGCYRASPTPEHLRGQRDKQRDKHQIERPAKYSFELIPADGALGGTDQFCWVIRDAILEHQRDISHVGDVRSDVSTDNDEIGFLARFERSDTISLIQEFGAVQGGDPNRVSRTQTRLDQ